MVVELIGGNHVFWMGVVTLLDLSCHLHQKCPLLFKLVCIAIPLYITQAFIVSLCDRKQLFLFDFECMLLYVLTCLSSCLHWNDIMWMRRPGLYHILMVALVCHTQLTNCLLLFCCLFSLILICSFSSGQEQRQALSVNFSRHLNWPKFPVQALPMTCWSILYKSWNRKSCGLRLCVQCAELLTCFCSLCVLLELLLF